MPHLKGLAVWMWCGVQLASEKLRQSMVLAPASRMDLVAGYFVKRLESYFHPSGATLTPRWG